MKQKSRNSIIVTTFLLIAITSFCFIQPVRGQDNFTAPALSRPSSSRCHNPRPPSNSVNIPLSSALRRSAPRPNSPARPVRPSRPTASERPQANKPVYGPVLPPGIGKHRPSGGTAPRGRNFANLVIANDNTSANRARWYNGVYENSLNVIEKINPAVAERYRRERLSVMVVPRLEMIPEALNKKFGTTELNTIPLSMDAAVITLGDSDGNSAGNIIGLEDSVLWDNNKSKEYNEMKVLSVLLHEGHHLGQPHNVASGMKVKLISRKESELDAFSKEIADLKNFHSKLVAAGDIKHASALAEVIKEEQFKYESWKR